MSERAPPMMLTSYMMLTINFPFLSTSSELCTASSSHVSYAYACYCALL